MAVGENSSGGGGPSAPSGALASGSGESAGLPFIVPPGWRLFYVVARYSVPAAEWLRSYCEGVIGCCPVDVPPAESGSGGSGSGPSGSGTSGSGSSGASGSGGSGFPGICSHSWVQNYGSSSGESGSGSGSGGGNPECDPPDPSCPSPSWLRREGQRYIDLSVGFASSTMRQMGEAMLCAAQMLASHPTVCLSISEIQNPPLFGPCNSIGGIQLATYWPMILQLWHGYAQAHPGAQDAVCLGLDLPIDDIPQAAIQRVRLQLPHGSKFLDRKCLEVSTSPRCDPCVSSA